MAKRLHIPYDSDLIESISSEFDLRAPNKEALRKLIFTLDGDYDPEVIQVMNLATGVGKTYLMAAFMEYLRRQGVGNVVIVTLARRFRLRRSRTSPPEVVATSKVLKSHLMWSHLKTTRPGSQDRMEQHSSHLEERHRCLHSSSTSSSSSLLRRRKVEPATEAKMPCGGSRAASTRTLVCSSTT